MVNNIKVLVDNNNWKDTVPIVVMHYRDMEMTDPGAPLLIKVRRQYAHMAGGGDGGRLDYEPDVTITARSYYPDAPDEFFQEVCDLLSWPR